MAKRRKARKSTADCKITSHGPGRSKICKCGGKYAKKSRCK